MRKKLLYIENSNDDKCSIKNQQPRRVKLNTKQDREGGKHKMENSRPLGRTGFCGMHLFQYFGCQQFLLVEQ